MVMFLIIFSTFQYNPSTKTSCNLLEAFVSLAVISLVVLLLSPTFLITLDYDISAPSYVLNGTGMQ